MKIKTNNDKPPCPKCKTNAEITKAGSRQTKSGISYRFFCKTCKFKFTQIPESVSPPITKYSDEVILYALKLSSQTSYTYKKEIRLTPYEIADFVNKRFKLNLNHDIISKWISNYTPNKLSTSVQEKKPPLSIKLLQLDLPDPDRIFKPYKINATTKA